MAHVVKCHGMSDLGKRRKRQIFVHIPSMCNKVVVCWHKMAVNQMYRNTPPHPHRINHRISNHESLDVLVCSFEISCARAFSAARFFLLSLIWPRSSRSVFPDIYLHSRIFGSHFVFRGWKTSNKATEETRTSCFAYFQQKSSWCISFLTVFPSIAFHTFVLQRTQNQSNCSVQSGFSLFGR